MANLNRNTGFRYFTFIRKRIDDFCETQSPSNGEIYVYESYFGGERIKGKGDRSTYKMPPVFGILNVAV